MINHRNIESVETRSLSTRSLLLSVLLGSHPPRLPLSALVAFCGLFERRAGTVRTALSRMAAAGEVVQVERPDGSAAYEVAGPLLERQRQQDVGRGAATVEWDGRWITAIVLADARPVAERRRFRSQMVGSKMGELRPDVWMRPANLDPPAADDGLVVSIGSLDGPPDADLVGELWDLDAIDARSEELRTALGRDDGSDLAATFLVLAATLNHLRVEPQLPVALGRTDTGDGLRRAYATSEQRFQTDLRAFLADVSTFS